MTSPAHASNRGRNRVYTFAPPLVPEPIEVFSVTTILSNGMPAMALKIWGENQIREQAVAHRTDLATMTEAEAHAFLKGHPDKIMRAAGDRGTDIHSLAEKIFEGQNVDGFADMYPIQVDAVRAFLSDFNVRPVRAEGTVINPDPLGYAGTFDGIADIDGVRTLFDWKTSKGIYPKSALQCAAYVRARWAVNDDDTLTSMADYGIEQVGIVHLTPTGYGWHPSPFAIDDLYQTFVHVHGVAMFELDGHKGVIPAKSVDPDALPTYRAEVRARIAQLIEWGGGDDLAAIWPAPVPTFRQLDEASEVHTTHQLDAIEYAVRRIEPRHRPKPPVADKQRHDELIVMLTGHPHLALIQKYATDVPNLRSYAATVDQLDVLERITVIVTKAPDPEDMAARLWRATKGRTTNPADATQDEVDAFMRTRASKKGAAA